MAVPQIRQVAGNSKRDFGETLTEMPFASRFRLCVSRVAGPSLRAAFDVIGHRDRAIPSANGDKARLQVCEVSDS